MRSFILIFALALAVRGALLASWMVPREYVLAPRHVEVEAVAKELASTGRYANPYAIPTGPTAHPLPIHTGLLALIYSLLGVTPAAAYLRTVLGVAACAALYASLPWLARQLGLGMRAGMIGGLLAAFLPLYGLGEVLGWLWTEALTALALGGLLAWFLRRWVGGGGRSIGASLLLGVAAGIAFHLAPALLPVVVGCAGFELWWRRDRRKWAGALAITVGAFLACLPWAWRNYVTFQEIFFIRSNFGLELRIANHDGAIADLWTTNVMPHPGRDPNQARELRELGEMEYMRRARQEAIEWMRSHPGAFLSLTAARVWHIWFGPPNRPLEAIPTAGLTLLAMLGLRRSWRSLTIPQRAALLIPLASFPLVYYLVGYSARYLFPLYGLLLVLAGVWLAASMGGHGAEPAVRVQAR